MLENLEVKLTFNSFSKRQYHQSPEKDFISPLPLHTSGSLKRVAWGFVELEMFDVH